MPQIHLKQNGGVIEWNELDWTVGLHPGSSFDNLVRLKQVLKGNGRLVNIDPFRSYGVLQPGAAPVNATNDTATLGGALQSAIVTADASLVYGVDIAGLVQKYTTGTNTITNGGGTFPHTITGTSPVGQDVIVYKHNSGGTTSADQKFSFFYSYYNNANWNIGAYVNFASFDDTFMSGTVASPLDITSSDGDDVAQRTAPHTLTVGSDDVLYIVSGRYVHAYDGAVGNNGTFSARVLSLPVGFQALGSIKYNDFLLIAGNYYASSLGAGTINSGEALVYVWNYTDTDITQVISLSDPYVASIFTWRGAPHVITYGTYGSKGSVKIKQIVGNNAVKVVDLPASLPPSFRGVDSASTLLYLNCAGKVITVGDQSKDAGYEINYISSAGVTGNNGWIKNIADFGLLVSSSSGSTYHLTKMENGSGTAAASFQSLYTEPPFPTGFYGQVKNVVVVFKNEVTVDASKAFSLYLEPNYTVADTPIISGDTSLSVPLIKKYEYTTTGVPLPVFTSLGMRAVWTNASSSFADWFAISKVLVEYELKEY